MLTMEHQKQWGTMDCQNHVSKQWSIKQWIETMDRNNGSKQWIKRMECQDSGVSKQWFQNNGETHHTPHTHHTTHHNTPHTTHTTTPHANAMESISNNGVLIHYQRSVKCFDVGLILLHCFDTPLFVALHCFDTPLF